MVDRLDPYLDTISCEELIPVYVRDLIKGGVKLRKVKSKIYGLDSYVFSKKMTLDILAEDINSQEDVILAAASNFIQSLNDHIVYKCLFIGVTEYGDIKTSSEGGFHISKYSRPEFIFMKVKSGVTQFGHRYKGIRFDSYTIAYKRWLLVSEIDDLRAEMMKAFEKLERLEMSAGEQKMPGMVAELKTPGFNKLYYNR